MNNFVSYVKAFLGRLPAVLPAALFLIFLSVGNTAYAAVSGGGGGTSGGTGGSAAAPTTPGTVTTVICNIISFVHGIGLPIMTGVILGSSIMAIFGRMPWPAIVTLIVFTAIFFGADQVVSALGQGVSIGASCPP